MRSTRQLHLLLVLIGGLLLATGAVRVAPRVVADGPSCVDVAADVQLRYHGHYGPVPSTDVMQAMMQRNLGNGAAVGDYNADGYLDIYLLGQSGHLSRLFRNDPGPGGGRRFTDVTTQAGLGLQTGSSRVALFTDLDGDTRPDLVVVNDYAPGTDLIPSRLYRNAGDGTFIDITEGSGFDPLGYIVGGLSATDWNSDGLPDLYVSYWTEELGGDPALSVIRGRFPGSNRLYLNLGGGRFRDVTTAVGLPILTQDTFASVFYDFTADGRPDLYLAVDHRADMFFVSDGDRLRDESVPAGVRHVGNDMGIAVTDLDRNGVPDLFVTNIYDHDREIGTTPRGNTLLMGHRDERGRVTFTDEAYDRGVFDSAFGWGAGFVDIDGDGTMDLYAVQGFKEFIGRISPSLRDARAYLFMNDGSGQFTRVEGNGCDVPGDQRALVVLDYDRDGRPDLLITQVDGPTRLLANRSTPRNHWLTVVADGPGATPINARITVVAGGRRSTQYLLAGASYLAGPPMEAYFGLGESTVAELVEIAWASGVTTELRSVAADQILSVRAPNP